MSIREREPNEACVNCHYLMKEFNPYKLEISSDQRNTIRNHDYSWLGSHYALACYHGIWDEGYNCNVEDRDQVIVRTDRKDGCFFFEYKPGTLFPAAEKLQKIEMEMMHMKVNLSSNRNPWVSGSFYLFAFVLVTVLFLTVSEMVHPVALPLVIIAALLAISIVGAFQLRQDKTLSQKNFILLMGLTFRQLPFIHKLKKADNRESLKYDMYRPTGHRSGRVIMRELYKSVSYF